MNIPECPFCKKRMLSVSVRWTCQHHPTQIIYIYDPIVPLNHFHFYNDNKCWNFYVENVSPFILHAYYINELMYKGLMPRNFSPENCLEFIDRILKLKIYL